MDPHMNRFHQGKGDNMLRNCLLVVSFTLTAMFSAPAGAQPAWTQVGTLSCRVDPNIGFIIVGHQPMQCMYNQVPGAVPQVPPQSYDGAINTVGLAIGISTGSVLGWAVFAPTMACQLVHSPANMLAFQRTSASVWAPARTFFLADLIAPSPFSRYRFRDRSH